MPDFKLIDSHQHVFWHGRDDAGLVQDLDANNIELAWLLTWEESTAQMGASAVMAKLDPRGRHFGSDEVAIPLATVIDVCRRYPDRFIAGYCPNPLDPQAVQKLEAAIEILNVRVCGEWKFGMLFDDPRCIEIFRLAGSRGLPVVLHLDVPYLPPNGGRYVGNASWKGGTTDNLERALMACSDTNFIGHAPGFWREMAADADNFPQAYLNPSVKIGGKLPRLFDRYPNLFADLSAGSALRALKADPDYARDFIIEYADRLLFGRDYYGNELFSFLMDLNLPYDVWRKIGRENAEKLVAPCRRTIDDKKLG